MGFSGWNVLVGSFADWRAGTWTFETTARLHYQIGSTTHYNGDELITGYGDERIGQWGMFRHRTGFMRLETRFFTRLI